jgi:hypothetical protein
MPRPRNEKRKLAYRGRYGGTCGRSSSPPIAMDNVNYVILGRWCCSAHTKTEKYHVDTSNCVASIPKSARVI